MPAIEVLHLQKNYGDIIAVDLLSFEVPRGKTYALLGGNGAGKTTTLSMLLGLLLPTSGTIRILGIDMIRDRFKALPRMNFTSPYVDIPHRLTVDDQISARSVRSSAHVSRARHDRRHRTLGAHTVRVPGESVVQGMW